MTDDMNLVVLSGRLAAQPELRTFDSGTTLMRLLVAVKHGTPRRMDVLPVSMWNAGDHPALQASPGDRVWVGGTVQRRFWDDQTSRRSRLELVAHEVTLRPEDREIDANLAYAIDEASE